MQQVNVRAPVLLTVALAAQGRPAVVVNIGSGAATRARPGASHYCTSKAALEMATKATAVELADAGIRVNCVSPGFVTVDSPVNPVTDTYRDQVSRNPMGRPGDPAEIAAAVLWLASENASFVTGTVLRVDGGATAGTVRPAPALPIHHLAATQLDRRIVTHPDDYTVVGAGAIGGTLAHHLARSGHSVPSSTRTSRTSTRSVPTASWSSATEYAPPHQSTWPSLPTTRPARNPSAG